MNAQEKLKLIEWDDQLIVDSAHIDAQHRRFVDTINLLASSINENICAEQFPAIFHRLAYYAENHFMDEENYFMACNYPQLETHREQHREFIRQLIGFHKMYAEAGESICLQMYHYLQNWLRHHINHYDRAALKYIADN